MEGGRELSKHKRAREGGGERERLNGVSWTREKGAP